VQRRIGHRVWAECLQPTVRFITRQASFGRCVCLCLFPLGSIEMSATGGYLTTAIKGN